MIHGTQGKHVLLPIENECQRKVIILDTNILNLVLNDFVAAYWLSCSNV